MCEEEDDRSWREKKEIEATPLRALPVHSNPVILSINVNTKIISRGSARNRIHNFRVEAFYGNILKRGGTATLHPRNSVGYNTCHVLPARFDDLEL